MEDEAAAAAAAEAASQTEKHSLLSSNRSSSIKSGGSGIEGAASVIAFDTKKSWHFSLVKFCTYFGEIIKKLSARSCRNSAIRFRF
jgi:hypothetical protein